MPHAARCSQHCPFGSLPVHLSPSNTAPLPVGKGSSQGGTRQSCLRNALKALYTLPRSYNYVIPARHLNVQRMYKRVFCPAKGNSVKLLYLVSQSSSSLQQSLPGVFVHNQSADLWGYRAARGGFVSPTPPMPFLFRHGRWRGLGSSKKSRRLLGARAILIRRQGGRAFPKGTSFGFKLEQRFKLRK